MTKWSRCSLPSQSWASTTRSSWLPWRNTCLVRRALLQREAAIVLPSALSCLPLLLLLLPLCYCCLMVLPVCSPRPCGSGFSGRLEKCDPELIGTVMEYCLQTRCRSKPIFEAVAEDFVRRGEKHTTLQIAKQVIAMGRLNYLPQVSEMSLDIQLSVTNQLCSRKIKGDLCLWAPASFCSVSAPATCSRSWRAFCRPGSPSFSLAPS